MLKILNEKILRTDNEIERLYPNCKYLYVLDSLDRIADNDGYLYCVSTSEDSLDALFDERERLQEEGKICCIGEAIIMEGQWVYSTNIDHWRACKWQHS